MLVMLPSRVNGSVNERIILGSSSVAKKKKKAKFLNIVVCV